MTGLITLLVLTVVLEYIVYIIFFRKNFGKLFLYSIIINAVTNPVANIILSSYYRPGLLLILLIEFFVVLVEVFLIKYLMEVSYKRAIIVSLVVNIASAILGHLLFTFTPFGYFF